MRRLNITIFYLIFISFFAQGQIFISPTGDDNNNGTIDQPYATIGKALTVVQAGDTIYLRGGVYSSLTLTINISPDGTETNKYYLFSYPGERALLDFSDMPVSSSYRGINLRGDFWHVYGIDIKGAGDNGINISGSNNTVEFCSFFENHDTGLQLSNGASNNRIINCDSYFNSDPGQGNADGFAPKLDVGTNNYFYGCRAWQNSDDGWDGYLRGSDNVNTTVEYSWCFANGYLKDGAPSSGNGNGYKMGGGDNGNNLNLAHNFVIKNSLAFDNRVKGYDQNNNRGSMILHNSSAYRNGTNYSIPGIINFGETAEVINCAVLGTAGPLISLVEQQTNSWNSGFNITVDDFVSIDTTGIRGPRKADGSLPDINFLHLAAGSELIDAGTDVGLPFEGAAPDIGAFEYGLIVPVELVAFNALVHGKDILLKWSTATEVNNRGFEIQKMFDDDKYMTIGFINGGGSIVERKEYQFFDKNVFKGINRYRLKQIDYDGTFSYSDAAEVDLSIPVEFTLSQNYPNPFNPITTINFSLKEKGDVSLKVFSIVGELVASLVNNDLLEAGNYSVEFKGEGLSSGTYIYVLRQGNNISSKKMILMK